MIKLKDIIKESKWSDRKWGDPLPTLEDYMTEAETMKLKPKGGGKTVTFTDKDNYDDAKKSGKYEKPEGEKEEPSGKLGGGDFERETEPERGEPEGGAGDSDAAKAAIDRGEYGQHDPSSGDKPQAKRSDRYKDVDTSWHDDPEAVAAQGQQGMQPGQAEPKGGAAKEITKDMKSIESSGGNNVLLAKGTADHIAKHNKPGEGSVFSDDISMDDVQNAISEIPEEFYEKGGGVHTTTVPNAGYNLVQKASDIKKDHPNAKKIMVKKQVGYDRDKKEPIMKEVPAYIIDDDKEKFKTDQLSVVVRPSNPDFMDDEVKNNSDVKKDLDGKKSHSVLTSFPGDPDVPTADKWEESGHAIIIPNGGKDADKTNWVEEPDTGGGGDLTTQIAKAEKEYKSASQAAMAMGQYSQAGDPRYDDAADDALKKLRALKAKKDGKKESITINGKQYKRISESVEPTIFDPHKEAKKQLGSLYSRMIGK